MQKLHLLVSCLKGNALKMVNPVSVPQAKHAKTLVSLSVKNKNPGWMRCKGFYLQEPLFVISFCWKCEAYLFLDII